VGGPIRIQAAQGGDGGLKLVQANALQWAPSRVPQGMDAVRRKNTPLPGRLFVWVGGRLSDLVHGFLVDYFTMWMIRRRCENGSRPSALEESLEKGMNKSWGRKIKGRDCCALIDSLLVALDVALAMKEGWEGMALSSKRAPGLGSSSVKRDERGKMDNVGSLGSCREEKQRGTSAFEDGSGSMGQGKAAARADGRHHTLTTWDGQD